MADQPQADSSDPQDPTPQPAASSPDADLPPAEAATPVPPADADDAATPDAPESAETDPFIDTPPIEQSLDDLQTALDAAAQPGDDAPADPDAPGIDEALIDDASLEELLKQASFDDPSNIEASAPPVGADPVDLPDFTRVIEEAQVSSIDLLRDVDLNVKIELGRSRMLVEDVLKLGEGSVVELDKLAGDPVDVFVNERLVARGEVLVLNDTFCVRINEIVPGVKEEGM